MISFETDQFSFQWKLLPKESCGRNTSVQITRIKKKKKAITMLNILSCAFNEFDTCATGKLLNLSNRL